MPQADFPRLLEAQYAGYTNDLPLWLSLAATSGSPVLELGCGPGRVLLALAQVGHEVYGLDNDPAMLQRLSRRLTPELSQQVHLHLGDVRSFELGRRFPLVLLPCNTLASLDDAEAACALDAIRAHLTPHGLLAAELPHPNEALASLDEDEPLTDFVEPETGNPVQLYARQVASPGSPFVDVLWKYDELLPDGQVLRTEVPTRYYLRAPEGMARMLSEAGFGSVQLHGDYDLSPYSPEALRLIVLAKAAA
jgi:SAM-dependent methyltransferase